MGISLTMRKTRPGAAAVEFAVVMIVLIPLLLGVWEIGRLVNVQQIVSSAAREGGRHASTGLKTTAEVKNTVLAYLQNAGLTNITAVAADENDLKSGGKVHVVVKVFDTNGSELSGVDAKDAQQNYKIEVQVLIMFKDIRYSPTNMFLTTDTRVGQTVSWRCMKDVPVVVNNTIPLS